MKAWLLDRLGGALETGTPIPEPRPGGIVLRIEASALMSYLKAYVEDVPIYNPPEGWFTPGGNAVGIVHAIGPEVYHLKPGQRAPPRWRPRRRPTASNASSSSRPEQFPGDAPHRSAMSYHASSLSSAKTSTLRPPTISPSNLCVTWMRDMPSCSDEAGNRCR